MMVLTDYMKLYGEIIFQISSTERRELIENNYEVNITRHAFLPTVHLERLQQYLTKSYFRDKCLLYTNEEYSKLKELQQQWEDNLKEVIFDEKIEQKYLTSKNYFERLIERVRAMANVLDITDMPDYVIEE